MNKVYNSCGEAVADVFDGATTMFGGFGSAGIPSHLIIALWRQGAKCLTTIANNCGYSVCDMTQEVVEAITLERPPDHAILIACGRVRKAIASFPIAMRTEMVTAFEKLYREGKIELEVVPQGTLAERIRAGGAGIPAFFTPTGVGTVVEKGKEKRNFDGKGHLLELALRADFAFIKAYKADTMGNLIYRKAARNFNPVMATAANVTIAEVEEIVEPGELDPEAIVTPGIFVDRIVKVDRVDTWELIIRQLNLPTRRIVDKP